MTKQIFLLATRNKGKVREIKQILHNMPFDIKTLGDLKPTDNVEEAGKSYEENAVLKAQAIGQKTGLLTLGEDSGLEIDAFNGWPGIYSARHTIGSDEDKIDAILEKMENIPRERRTARYKSVVAIYDSKSKQTNIFQGSCEGFITEKRSGAKGFGYDPIFWSIDLNKTFAEVEAGEKNKVSHRGKAMDKCKQYLLQLQ